MRNRRNVASLTLAAALAVGWSAARAAEEAEAPETQKVTMAIPNTQCGNCVSALGASLQQVKGVKGVTEFSAENKLAVVELDPGMASVHQLAQAVADTQGLHGKPYQAMLLLQVEGLSDPETQKKIGEALKGIEGIVAAPVNEPQGILGVTFTKLEPSSGAGTTLDQVLGPLVAAGIKATPYLPSQV